LQTSEKRPTLLDRPSAVGAGDPKPAGAKFDVRRRFQDMLGDLAAFSMTSSLASTIAVPLVIIDFEPPVPPPVMVSIS
jgi:hypothetical protein